MEIKNALNNDKDIIIDVATERNNNMDLIKDERPKFKFDFKPTDFRDYIKSEKGLIRALGRKWKPNLKDIGRFAKMYQPVTSNYFKIDEEGKNHPVSILPISCRSSNLIESFGNQSAVSRLIKKCLRIGLLVRMDKNYHFDKRRTKRNYSYYYAYNKSAEHLVIDVCRRRKIDIEASMDKDYTIVGTLADAMKMPQTDYDRITLKTARIGLAGYNSKSAEETVKRVILAEKYGRLIMPRLAKIGTMNMRLPEEQRIVFNPNLKYSKNGRLIRIGLRATSHIVSLEKDEEKANGKTRMEYLTEYFGTDEIQEYDVRASIYQISHLLNFGEWVGNGQDPYERMFGRPFKNKAEREAYKSFCMALYFDNPNEIYAHNRRAIPFCVSQYGKDAIKEAIFKAEESMRGFTGDKFFNEVFLHESLMYIDFVYALRNMGIDVVQIYDGFYLRKGLIDEPELERIMRECAMKYLADYRAWLKGDGQAVDLGRAA